MRPFLALLAAIAAAFPLAAHAETVVLGADEWCPYNCDPASDRPGYMVEIAKRALAKDGHTVSYVVMPWSRALAESKAGRIDGAIGASADEAPEAVFPRTPLGHSVNVLAMSPERAAAFTYTGADSLKTLRIGGVQQYSYDGGEIDDYFASPAAKGMVELISGTEVQSQNLRKLLAGRIDALIENQNVLRLTLAEMRPQPDIAMVPVGDVTPLSIAFTSAKPSSTRYVELIDATIAEMRASGELATILARYGMTDWGS